MRAVVRSPNRLVALGLAVAFAGYGILSALTGRPLIAVLWLAAGALLLTGSLLGIRAARRVNVAAGAVWLVLGYAGLFLIGTPYDVLGMIPLDEVVLFGAATTQLAVGLGARRDVAALS